MENQEKYEIKLSLEQLEILAKLAANEACLEEEKSERAIYEGKEEFFDKLLDKLIAVLLS